MYLFLYMYIYIYMSLVLHRVCRYMYSTIYTDSVKSSYIKVTFFRIKLLLIKLKAHYAAIQLLNLIYRIISKINQCTILQIIIPKVCMSTRRQSKTLLTIDEHRSKIARNSDFDCHLS